MEPISNADRLVLLLRQKLQERAKASAAKRRRGAAAPSVPSGLHALAAIEGVDERPLRRAFLQNLLADQLGPELMNDAQFQQIVGRVTDAIEEDAEASQLLSRLIADLRPA